MKSPVIVYGPAGCGKTRLKAEIARCFGLPHIEDEWDGTTKCRMDTLYLTNLPGEEVQRAAPGTRRFEFSTLRIRRHGEHAPHPISEWNRR